MNPRERNLLIFCGTNYAINPEFMYRATFDAAAAIAGYSASTLVLAWFMRFFGLEYQLIPCGEDCFIDGVVFTGGFWPLLLVFMTTAEFICDKPCKLLTFPE